MASATLNPSNKFPVGTTVTVYARSNFPAYKQPEGAPQGSSTTSASMTASGVTFSSLLDDKEYVAYALVSSEHRYVSFRTPPAAASSGDTVLETVRAKAAVAAASVANVSLPPGGTSLSLDGVTLVNGDRVLLKDQTAPAENGIYVVGGVGSSVTLTRASDADAAGDLTSGTSVAVVGGTVNFDTVWRLVAVSAVTLGTTALYWTRIHPAYPTPARNPWGASGALAETADRSTLNWANNAATNATGRIRWQGGCVLRAGQTVTGIGFVTGNGAGASLTATFFSILRASDLTYLRSTAADAATSWASWTERRIALSSPYTPPVDTPVFLGVCQIGTTAATLAGPNPLGNAMGAPVIASLGATGLAAPPADGATHGALSNNTTGGAYAFVY